MDDVWKFLIAFICGMLVMKFMFAPSSDLGRPINKYFEMNRFIMECKEDEENLIETLQELNQLKNTNLFKENEKLEKELTNCRGKYAMFIFLSIIIVIMISLTIYFFINKYQNNKIGELEHNLFEKKIEVGKKEQELKKLNEEFNNYKSRKKRR